MSLQEAIEAAGVIRESACSSDVISLYSVEKVLWAKQTEFQKAIIAKVPGFGTSLFLDDEIQSTEADEAIYHECLVHPVMHSAPSRDRVLIIGGGEGATLREVLKWQDVKHVTWIDIDGELVNACQEHLAWANVSPIPECVAFKPMDIYDFFRIHSGPAYDVIIIDLPDPDIDLPYNSDEILQNTQFWRGVGKSLAPNGVFVTHCGPIRFSQGLHNGIQWMIEAAKTANIHLDEVEAYHIVIPSFQDDWAFLMSCKKSEAPNAGFGFQTRFLTRQAYNAIFTWAWDPYI
jgi:spermidine synthase